MIVPKQGSACGGMRRLGSAALACRSGDVMIEGACASFPDGVEGGEIAKCGLPLLGISEIGESVRAADASFSTF